MSKKALRSEKVIERVIIALDPSVPCVAALDAAVALASSLKARLLGLFVEDVNLIRLSELPNAHQISYLSAERDPLDRTRMQRALRVQSSQVRALVQAAARRARVEFSFHSVQGQVTRELLSAACRTDLIILGRARLNRSTRVCLGRTALEVARQSNGTVLLLQKGTPFLKPLLVLFDGSAVSGRALLTAVTLCRCSPSPILVYLFPRKGTRTARLQQKAEEILKTFQLSATYRELTTPDETGLLRALKSQASGALILGIESGPLKGEALKRLLDDVDHPVYIVH